MKTKTGVLVRKDDVKSVLAGIKFATRKTVLIGIPYDHTARPGDVGVSNAMIGHINEFGSPTQNIPARPHLVPGVLAVREQVTKILADGLVNGFARGNEGREYLNKAMHAAGLIAVASVKTTITDRLTPALSGYTIKRRLEKGRTGDLPLVDSAQYINSFTYVIRTAGGTRDAVA